MTPGSRKARDDNRSHYRTELPLGVLDETSASAMERGQCHALAASLAEQPGWGRVVVIAERTFSRGRPIGDQVLHCYAVSPDGMWVDVRGEHEPAGALEAWRDAFAGASNGFDASVETIDTDRAGPLGLATYAGSRALGLDVETPLLPTNLRLARSITPAVRDLGR